MKTFIKKVMVITITLFNWSESLHMKAFYCIFCIMLNTKDLADSDSA